MSKVSGTAKYLLISESLWSLGSGLFLPIFAIFTERVGGDIFDAGLAAGIFIIVTALVQYPVGLILDKKPAKWFIVSDYLIQGFVFIGYIFVTNTTQLFILQAILGIGNAIGDPSWESLFSRSLVKKYTGSAWANYHVITGLLSGFGIIGGSYIALEFGFTYLFLLGGILSFMAAFVLIKKLESNTTDY